MITFATLDKLRAWRASAAAPVALVPTMGALHEGHATLVREARTRAGENGAVVASIFVNPLQFGPGEDFGQYPRTLDADLAICEQNGADIVFAPAAGQLYADDASIRIIETKLSQVMCGASRPGHFDGVCTVVAKLFNIVQPHLAVFGKKDYQQLAIVRRLARDLDFPVTIQAIETVREADGLAMSSRNRYLSLEERTQATALFRALNRAAEAWRSGVSGAKNLREIVLDEIRTGAPLGRVDYVSVVDSRSLAAVDVVHDQGLIALAVYFGKARLIDNIELHRDQSGG